MEIEHHTYELNNIHLHVVEAGPADGEPMVFLHGFPEFWYGWRKQIAYFSQQGYRVIVPDQRGYNLSSKPEGKRAYQMQELTEDIAALIHRLGSTKVTLIGHDWGGAVAWAMANRFPDLLKKLVILNLPHPTVMKKGFLHWPKQLLKSWYIGFFQLPSLPELSCSAFNYSLLAQSMKRSSRKNTFSKEDLKHYKTAWQQPKAIHSMINWYRAIRQGSLEIEDKKIRIPTLLLWGKQDQFLSHEMARPSIGKCQNGKLIMLNDATHWLQHEKPEIVNSHIHEFIRSTENSLTSIAP